MYDPKNQDNRTALKNEVDTDPVAIGYAPVKEITKQLLSLLNEAVNNTTSATVKIPVEELDIPDVARVVDPAEYAAITNEYDKEFVKMFIHRQLDERLEPYQVKMVEIFPANSATFAAIQALRDKPASRAEELFGVNTVISEKDWFAARDHG